MPPPIAPEMPTNDALDQIHANLASLSFLHRRAALRREGFPRFLYKFRHAEPHDDVITRLRSIIVESHLWLSHHESFNDPFDMKAYMVLDGTDRQIRERFKALVADHSAAPRRQRKEMLGNIMNMPRDAMLAHLNQTLRLSAGRAGICSFAGNPHSIVMWTHYAQNHQGVCLQFEVARDARTFAFAQQVHYRDEYPRVNFTVREDMANHLYTVMTRKHPGWEYEGEWRIIHLQGANSMLPFRPEALVRVVFGCRSSPTLVDSVRGLLSERRAAGLPAISLYQCSPAPKKYRLIAQRISSTP